MSRKSFAQISGRTLDYLARRHPWFDAIQRRKLLAVVMLLGYGAFVLLLIWQVHDGADDGWKELVKTYSALFFDLLILFLLSVAFLLVRGYYNEERTRVDTDLLPDRRFFLPLDASSVDITMDDDVEFFQRHPAVTAILDALPLDQSDFFLAHAGSLDIPKLTLCSIELLDDGGVRLHLGVAAFKEFFFSHHFADYALSRSSSKDSGRRETLRSLFGDVYARCYESFFRRGSNTLQFLKYTPNTMGVTGCVRVVCGKESAYFLQRRGHHESAARGVFHLSYAGTINAYPDYARLHEPITLDMLADDEFVDEFMEAEPGLFLAAREPELRVTHELVGLCANSQYLFQPELFVLSTIRVENASVLGDALREFSLEKAGRFLALPSLGDLPSYLAEAKARLRPLCRIAIETLYEPHLAAASVAVLDEGEEVLEKEEEALAC